MVEKDARNTIEFYGAVGELVDPADSKSAAIKSVSVRFRPALLSLATYIVTSTQDQFCKL